MELTRYHGSLNLESFGSLFVIQLAQKTSTPPKPVSKQAQAFQSVLNSQQSLSLGPDKFSVFQLKNQTSQKIKEEDVLP